jgi:predicted metal-dependent phosphoesterase TrpH
MVNIEMHSHTCFSHDGFITPRTFTRQCQKRGLDCVCITDHDCLKSTKEFAKWTPIRIVPGQEITTGQGDIIGLFLKEEIPPHLGIEATIEKISSQAGIVYLPHPFDEFRRSAVKLQDAEKFKDRIDIVEVFNSRTFNPRYCAMALDFAKKNGLAIAVGSDSHHHLELGNAFMRMEDFDGPVEFLEHFLLY